MKKTYPVFSYFLFMTLYLLVLLLIGQKQAYAEEQDPAGAAGFTYTIDYPENQMEDDLGYYKLKVAPGDRQEVTIHLSNQGVETSTIEVQYNSAKTNQNGVIEYGESKLQTDNSMKFKFNEIVTGEKSVELKPGETKDLTLNLQIPETAYEGVIAGGIQLMRAKQGEEENVKGSQVVNQYAYVIGMLLQETDTTILPDLALNNIRAAQNNYRNSVFVNVSNVMPTYLNDMTVEVQIKKKGKEAILYERKQADMRMAPNSVLDFPVMMNGEKMKAGDYSGHILITAGEQKWEWQEDFSIAKDEAEKYNNRDVSLVQEKGINWIVLCILVLGTFMILISLRFVIRRLSNKKTVKKRA